MHVVSRPLCPKSLVPTRVVASVVLAVLLLPVFRAAPARADDGTSAARERAAGRSLERGLSWLAASWEKADGGGAKAAGAADATRQPYVATAALAGLAFLQDGAEPDKGRYGAALRRCLDFVTAHADPKTGLIGHPDAGPMYHHGLATYFLAEAFARTNDPAVKETLTAAVRLIEKAQNDLGGWRYLPRPADADSSVTSCQLVALLAARKAGIDVDDKVVERGVKFLLTCQSADGGIQYMPTGTGGSGPARSAAALAAFTVAGGRAGAAGPRDYDRAVKYFTAQPAQARAAQGHYYYASYYLAHALRNGPDDARARLYPPLRDALVARQQADGSWTDELTPEYATAAAVFVLGTPDSRLNLFKAKAE